ncbi:MAG: hypothetical protein HETSPECPRED_001539 [Heterodermia speciosa]|uniref:Uncharacterized protein n=1 Tax=Heterodermia speciosa TaxID=116794 RepID=A0A8H3J223_9LECA|nr:MAG: hypothetical protein HETSPECPRED_001539 [Heterodermia speciosa]
MASFEDSSNRVSSSRIKHEATCAPILASTSTSTSTSTSNHNSSNRAHSSALGALSTETRSDLVLPQNPTLAANQSSSTEPGFHERVSRAKGDFADYLKSENFAGHYLSIDSPDGPLRRQDRGSITSQARTKYIVENFEWDKDRHRWTFRGNTIVTEDRIYAVILSYQRILPHASQNVLFDAISRCVEGVQNMAVWKAKQLWNQHELGSLDTADDSLWGGERRAVMPREAKPRTFSNNKRKRQSLSERATDVRSNPGIGDKRYRRSKLKKYNESVELSSEEESSSSDDDQPRGSRTMRPAVSKTHTRSTRILDSETQANDDLEIVSVSTIKPSLPSRSHNPQEAKSNFKPEFPSDPEQPTATILPAHVINATSLLVSLSNQPDRAPANVPFSQCLNLAQLFETLVTECDLKGKAASELSQVSAKNTWDQKRLLIRKNRPRDWMLFVDSLRKAWERDASRFAEDGCEVEMVVHVGS